MGVPRAIRTESELTVRPAVGADEPFLSEMLLLAAFPPGSATPAPEAIDQDERLARYLAGWGRAGDAGVIAEAAGQPIGAAWYRRFVAASPGHGFVSEDVPELSIAVASAWRGRGVGRALLAALIEAARDGNVPALSLSVSRRNPVAMRLYRSIGFVSVAGDEEHPTMLLELAPHSPQAIQQRTRCGRRCRSGRVGPAPHGKGRPQQPLSDD